MLGLLRGDLSIKRRNRAPDPRSCGGSGDRAIAQAFCSRFEGQPFADRLIPAMLQEGAAINQQIISGELSPDAGRDLIFSLAKEAYGLPPSTIADGADWLNDNLIPDESGDVFESRSAEPPGPYSDLIRRLFTNEAERESARAVVSVMDREPQLQSRIAPLLHELAGAHEGSSGRGTTFRVS
jgi:hypothetical protein